ncbi:hypothetical protein PFICI_06887 [Pestalotiopsis fici W106-1]|uniref:Zinc chelation protein SecC n=1 Tax=Pestalotiopsis fici (strain W106-1 / CGMCC3.15140) TaxID=1229662 RepID=W3X754_PESFW|nr:uncharacterized protein PFICI_06887 [Pestalotiopsis fici W106-1]ETS81885.1 hypothetical protein PFICI_06887 [Pestalotiopsis fici W106-1]
MATRKVRFDFQCDRTLTFQHDVPASLVGPNAAMAPDYRDGYVQAVLPVMRAHSDECIAASNPVCAVCEKAPTKSVLTTPMSYLHLQEPLVAVLVTPVCEKPKCSTDGQRHVDAMLAEVLGMPEGEVVSRDGVGKPSKISRNAQCPCGSSRKYKKCCGAASTDESTTV